MTVRNARAIWKGTLKDGKGKMRVGSGAFKVPYSFATRFEEEPGTNPEELIGAANAGCFSMFLSGLLTSNGTPPEKVKTTAKVHLNRDDRGPVINKIELDCQALVPGLTNEVFQEKAAEAKANCPVSRALAGPEIILTATLLD
jgi:lipoyl-dependent peroxiredoxin